MTNSCAALGLLQYRTSGQEHVAGEAAPWWQPGDKDGQRRHPSISFSDTPQRSNFSLLTRLVLSHGTASLHLLRQGLGLLHMASTGRTKGPVLLLPVGTFHQGNRLELPSP